MANKPINLDVKRGDTGVWAIAVVDGAGAPADITGAVLRLYVKVSRYDADIAALVKLDSAGLGGIVINDAGRGIATVTIPAATFAAIQFDTGYPYDCQITEASGRVTTLAEGTLTVSVDVTQAS